MAKKKFIGIIVAILAIGAVASSQSQFAHREMRAASAHFSWFFNAPSVNGTSNLPSPNRGDIAVDTSLTTPAFYGYDGSNWKSFENTGTASLNIRSVTSTDTAQPTDDVLVLSSTSFAETLPVASSNSGKVLRFVHNGTSLTDTYTVTPNGSDTINNGANYILYTNGEDLTLVADATHNNWIIIAHTANTIWTNLGNNTITAVTTSPVQTGNTKSVDKLWWRRVGTNAEIRIEFKQTAAGTNTIGSGDYLFQIPSNMTIDTTSLTTFGGASIGAPNVDWANTNVVGSYIATAGAFMSSGGVYVYDSSHIRLGGLAMNTSGTFELQFIGSSAGALTNTNQVYTATFSVPISGWQP